MTKISTTTHPELTPAERRALRAQTEGAAYRIRFSEIRITRKSDGKVGRIRFALISRPGQATPYTVRLRNDGTPCRCSCPSHTRLREMAEGTGTAAEECKHGMLVRLANGQDQDPAPPAATEAERVERARRDAHLWD